MPARASYLRFFLCVVAVLFVWLAPRVARAQNITINQEQSLPRVYPDGSSVTKRPTNLDPEAVSNQDCLQDQRIRFPITIDQVQGNASLQAWASIGGDCTALTNRQGNSQVCWPLVTGIPLQQATQIDIPVRAIMAGAAPGSATNLLQGDSMCGQVDLTNIAVSFLYFAPGVTDKPAASKNVTIKVDTVGPEPPTGLSTLPGNTRIHVRWDNVSGEGGVSVLSGVNIYCEPAGSAPVSTAPADAGTITVCDDAAVDGADAADGEVADANCREVPAEGGASSSRNTSACQSPHLSSADGGRMFVTSVLDPFKCGSLAGNQGSGATADTLNGAPLENFKTYAVSVAATDALGNVGRLSDPICETPEPTNDFWQNYKNAGGGSGGGFCSTSGPGLPLGSASVVGVAVALVLSTLRRTKRRDRR
jgi:hypothetical protein